MDKHLIVKQIRFNKRQLGLLERDIYKKEEEIKKSNKELSLLMKDKEDLLSLIDNYESEIKPESQVISELRDAAKNMVMAVEKTRERKTRWKKEITSIVVRNPRSTTEMVEYELSIISPDIFRLHKPSHIKRMIRETLKKNDFIEDEVEDELGKITQYYTFRG